MAKMTREHLHSIAERAAAENAAKAAEANEQRKQAREARIEAAAREFQAKRMEHLPELLKRKAEAGAFEHDVWSQEIGHLKDEELEATIRGLRYVKEWLQEAGFDATYHDDGGQNIMDYGYTRHVILKAAW